MTDLLFAENGVFHPDLNGRLNSDGSMKVYLNRGGITPIHDRPESDRWKMSIREGTGDRIRRSRLRYRPQTEFGIVSIERFHTNDRMSQMVIHGDTVYLAGQVALGAPGESVADQTRAILGQIDTVYLAGLGAEAGTDKSKPR